MIDDVAAGRLEKLGQLRAGSADLVARGRGRLIDRLGDLAVDIGQFADA